MDYRDKDKKRLNKAALWFERDVFQNLIDEKDEDADLEKMVEVIKRKGAKIIGEDTENDGPKSKKAGIVEDMKESTNAIDDSDSEDDSDFDSDSDYDVNEHHVSVNNTKKDGFEIVKGSSGKFA